MNWQSPLYRYQNDINFKSLVDMMLSHIMACNYTPSEMREAAMLASIRYYEMRPQGMIVPVDKLNKLIIAIELGVREEEL